MELNVGQLIEQPLPVIDRSFESLHQIFLDIQQHSSELDFNITRDHRFSKRDWKSILSHELLALYSWSLKRIVYSQSNEIAEPSLYKNIYCFQPRYGIALHLIRRVVPFAMLGLKTSCIFSDETRNEAASILQYFITLLKLKPIILIARSEAGQIKDSKNNLMMVTGRKETFETIKKKFMRSKVIGSVGSEAILIASSIEKGKAFLSTQKKLKQSCTNINNIIVPPGKKLNTILHEYNPTVVHDPESYLSRRFVNSSPYFCLQYQNGVAAGQGLKPGMCADPAHGYPGDYLL